jgi:two-component system, OmpR family, sensor kinase
VKLFGKLRWRVLAHGVAVVLLMSGAVLVADRLLVVRWAQREIDEHRLHLTDRTTIYGPDGEILASNADPPVPPPTPDEWRILAKGGEASVRDQIVKSALFRGGAFVGVSVRHLLPFQVAPYPGPPLALILLALSACMAATLLASVPLARSVVRPIEALARSVKLFGSGRLWTRASIQRGDEIGDLASSFDEMAARIEALVRSEKRLLANVSHELRTPLARIRVVLELASDGEPQRVRSYLSEIAQDLGELECLVDDVLATARLEAASGGMGEAKLPLHWSTVDVGSLIDRSRARFASLYPERELRVVAEGELPELRCDPALLRRVVDNLLDNAAKHAEGATIELKASADEGDVRIEIADRGPGMTPEVAAHAFDPFYRADESRDRRRGGVGLGLSIIRSVVEAHGGKVELETAPGRGTSVTARIPRRTGHA